MKKKPWISIPANLNTVHSCLNRYSFVHRTNSHLLIFLQSVNFICVGKKSKKTGGNSSSKGGLRAEMEGLRAHLDTTNSERTPLSGETLRQFYRYACRIFF